MPSDQQQTDTDQYDALLRAMEPGLLLTVNMSDESSLPSDELRVTDSADDETLVRLEGTSDHWRIQRDRRGELVLEKCTNDGSSHYATVTTFEVIGHV